MKLRQRVLLLFGAAVVAALATMVIAEVSVHAYGDYDFSEAKWTLRGGPFIILESHAAWPHLDIPAEWRLKPLGMLLSVGFWMGILGLAWLTVAVVRSAWQPQRSEDPAETPTP